MLSWPLSIGLISLVLVALQLVLMQLLAYAHGHHLAYIVISVALLGFGAGGSILMLWRDQQRLLRWYPGLLALCAVVLVWMPLPAALLLRGFVVDLLFTGWMHWLRLSLLGLVYVLPFFLGAVALSLAFRGQVQRIGSLYAANLVGSACGAGGGLLLLYVLLPESILPLLGVLALLAAMVAGISRRGLAMAVCLMVPAIWFGTPPGLSAYKPLAYALLLPDAVVTPPRPHPLGRVEVVEAPTLRYAPDLSLRYRGAVPVVPHVFVHGEQAAVLTDAVSAAILLETPLGLAVRLHPQGRGLLLQPEGPGEALLLAASGGEATLVEPHRRLVDLYRKQVPDTIRVMVADPRAYLASSVAGQTVYDTIVFPRAGAFGGYSGLQALGENHLFTVEAVAQAYRRLAPGGVLLLPVWFDDPLRQPLRMADLARTGLLAAGIADPAAHLAVIRGWGSMLILVYRDPVSVSQLTFLDAFTDDKGFDRLFPEHAGSRRHGPADAPPASLLRTLLGGDAAAFLAAYRFDVRAPVDRRPFLNQFVRPGDGGGDLAFLTVSERGERVLQLVILQLAIAVGLVVFLPLCRVRAAAWWMQRWGLFYFSGLGLGFILYEVSLIQMLAPLLGSTVTSVAFVISLLLLGMGGGSILSVRVRTAWAGWIACGAALLLAAQAIGVPLLIRGLLGTGVWGRLLILVPVLFFPAVLLGVLFPLGIRRFERVDPNLIPWACGIDGGLAVLAAPLAGLLAMRIGYPAVVMLAAGAYFFSACCGFLFSKTG